MIPLPLRLPFTLPALSPPPTKLNMRRTWKVKKSKTNVFAFLRLGFAFKCVYENPRLQNPGFWSPENIEVRRCRVSVLNIYNNMILWMPILDFGTFLDLSNSFLICWLRMSQILCNISLVHINFWRRIDPRHPGTSEISIYWKTIKVRTLKYEFRTFWVDAFRKRFEQWHPLSENSRCLSTVSGFRDKTSAVWW